MRYSIDFDKLINKLVPYYIGGRKLILYLQALIKPLQESNKAFQEWARNTRIEASMTSQVFKFEWFLNYKFSRYFKNPNEKITISSNIGNFGTPMYNEHSDLAGIKNVILYTEDETGSETASFYHEGERTKARSYSFAVQSPAIDTRLITRNDYLNQLKYQIDKYKLAGKTYIIILNNETL